MFTIGADPEAIVAQGFRSVSAIGRLPGTKDKPYKLQHGTCHPDNVMAEFNVTPADNKGSFVGNIQSCISEVNTLLKDDGCSIVEGMSAIYMPSELEHPDAREAGCSADYDAWNFGGENAAPDFNQTMERCAGGHIHIGAAIDDKLALVKACDLFLTIPTLQYEDPVRRNLYGKAGCFRDKSYGIEYRTIGNHWIWSKERIEWVFNQVEQMLKQYQKITLPTHLAEIINNHDIAEAQQLCKQFELASYPTMESS